MLINGEDFIMGSPKSEVGHLSAEIQHKVTLTPFYMAKNPVTVGEFR